MKELKFKKVKFLPLGNGATAITSPWGVCYYKGEMPEWLKRHERVHWKQYNEIGKIKFIFLYLFQNIIYGYRKNKYEIEARAAENRKI